MSALGLRGGTELEATVASVLLIHGPQKVILWEPQNSPTGTRVTSQLFSLPWDSEEDTWAFVGPRSLLCPCPCTSPVCQTLTLARHVWSWVCGCPPEQRMSEQGLKFSGSLGCPWLGTLLPSLAAFPLQGGGVFGVGYSEGLVGGLFCEGPSGSVYMCACD